jgi:hypothetical protein
MPNYATNVGVKTQHGRFTVVAIATAIGRDGKPLADDLSSSDTLRSSCSSVMPIKRGTGIK